MSLTTTKAPAPAKPGQSPTIAAIARAASELGVPLSVALAIANHESGLNPTAVGDNGTSFGLYQLHQGGELGAHTQAWADDPYNNARTALSEVARVARANPGKSWGEIAVLAQRPAESVRPGYIADVNRQVAAAGDNPLAYYAGRVSTTSTSTSSGGGTENAASTTNAAFPGGSWDPLNWFSGALSSGEQAAGGILERWTLTGVALVMGAGLVLLGAWRGFTPERQKITATVQDAGARAAEVAAL